jgi:predicted TIM-barrel fold metal-dependent hydrolase
MGFIDTDTHIWETDATWSYMSQAEKERFLPKVILNTGTDGVEKRSFAGSSWTMAHGEEPRGGEHGAEELAMYPPGTKTLDNLPLRIEAMDRYGIDVQIVNPTGFTHNVVDDPEEERAIMRSYNRWMADACSTSGGRLRWSVQMPTLSPDEAVKEVLWGAENGAACVHVQGHEHHMLLTDPFFEPIWRACEDTGLVVNVHVGQDSRKSPKPSRVGDVIWPVVSPVLGAFYNVAISDFNTKFPQLQWLFSEAGATWIPWLVQQISHIAGPHDLWRDVDSDWTVGSKTFMTENNLWVSAEADDDFVHVVNHMGDDNITLGSDYGHFDVGTDPEGHWKLINANPLPLGSAMKVSDANGRRLFNIDPAFRPSDKTLANA